MGEIHRATQVVRGRLGIGQGVGTFHHGIFWHGDECRRSGVLHGDVLRCRSAVSCVVGGNECPDDGVVACGISRNGFHLHGDTRGAARVDGLCQVEHQPFRTFHGVVLRNVQGGWGGVHHGDGLRVGGAVSGIVGGGEGPDDGIVAGAVAGNGLHLHGNTCGAACVDGLGQIEDQPLRAFCGVVRRHGQRWCGGVLNRNGLGGRAAVAGIVCCGEGACDGVVARGIARGRFTGHGDGDLSTVVRRHGIVHWHVVRALDGVVGRHEGEFGCGGVLHRDVL